MEDRCATDLPWGNGFNAAKGDSVAFTNVKNATAWTSTVHNGPGQIATSSFPLSKSNPFHCGQASS